MIPVEKAIQIVLDSAIQLETESVSLDKACSRIVSSDIQSDMDMPPFDKSAMDGYACKTADLEKPLKVIETIPAGTTPKHHIGTGECSKIMTGGVVPKGADCVVKVELSEENKGYVMITGKSSGRNICYQAEDVKTGDMVIPQGSYISPAEIAVLASVGCDPVPVARRPVLGIIATGSELVEPAQKPAPAQIRNSNSYQLLTQIERAGCIAKYFGIAEDTPEAIGSIIEQQISSVDIFLLSGGVSMGDYDYVPDVLKEKGFELLFHKVAIKPGKPIIFGRNNNTFAFGMPGNPVSAFMIFEVFVKPFCYKLMGGKYMPVSVPATLSETIGRKKPDRLAYIPISLSETGEAQKIKYHGSAHIQALTKANGYITIPVGVDKIETGKQVIVTLIR